MAQTVGKSRKSKAQIKAAKRVLGTETFAAITAVEGLQLSAASRRRLEDLKASGLSIEERRAEVLRVYTSFSSKK